MDLFGRKALKQQIDTVLKAIGDARMNAMANFNTQIFPHYRVIREQLVYQTMDDVYAVVSRLATTAAMIPYYGEGQNGEELPETDRINLILKELDFHLKEKIHMHLLISGECFLYKERTVGVNAKVKLIPLNPANVVVKVSDTFPFQVVGYQYVDSNKGASFDMPLEDCIFIKLENPTVNIENEARGLSPIKVLTQRLTRLQAQMDVSVAQMQNGGLPGVLYDKTPSFTADLANQHKENFARFLNNSSNKSAPYIWGGDVGYISIGSTLADMDLASLADIDFDKVCNVYGVSSTWFNNKSAATESNVKEMVKQIYTNAILPNIMRVQDAINKDLVPELSNGKIMYDISEIPELQEDFNQKAQIFATLPVMVPNDVLEGMGYDRVDDPLMDKPLIKSGYQTIEDILAMEELDITQDYDNGANNPQAGQNGGANTQGGNPTRNVPA